MAPESEGQRRYRVVWVYEKHEFTRVYLKYGEAEAHAWFLRGWSQASEVRVEEFLWPVREKGEKKEKE